MGRNNADFKGGTGEFTHPLYDGGDQPMYRWMHPGEYDEAKSTGFFKPNRNSSPTPQNAYSEPTHVLVKFAAQPRGVWRKKSSEGRQANFYVNPEPISFEHGTIVDKGRN
jgi:hypothetical protein